MTAHRYWSILIKETSTTGGTPALAELQMAESAFGANVCSGGTASATSTFSGTSAAGAFDGTFYSNNGAALWSANAVASSVNQRLSYDLGVGVTKDITSIRILARQTEGVGGGPAQSPRDFDVAHSDDGSSWTVAWSVTGETGWAEYELRQFHITAPSYSGSPHGTHAYWRLACLQAAGSAYAGSEMAFHSTPGGSQIASGGTPTAFQSFSGSFLPTNLFDSNTSSLWSSTDKTDPAWVQYHFASAVSVAEIVWQARNDSFYTQSPSRIAALWSDDGSAWNMAWSGNTTWGSAAQTHTFADPAYGMGGSVSGTIGPTEAKDTFAASGGAFPTGTWGSTEAKDAWVTPPFGTMGATEAHDTFAMIGFPDLRGTWGSTEAKDAFHMAGGAIPDLTLDSFASAIAVTPPGGPAPTQAQVTISTTFLDDVIVLMIANGGFWDYSLVSSVSDTAGLTWHRRSTHPANYAATGAKSVEIWWAHAPTPLSADVITVTTAATTGQLGLNVIAVAGANFSAPWDVHPYANQWNFRTMFGSSIETGFASANASKTMTLLMSAGAVAQSAANTGFPFTFLGTVNGAEWHGGNALNVGSAYNINGTALDQSLVEFGPNGNSQFYSDSIVQAGQTGTDQEILYWLDGFFWQIGTGAQIWPSNVSIFTAANGTVQCNLSLSSTNEVAIAVVSLYSAGGAGQVSSIADSAGLASGWARRSRKTSVDGTMALEVWYAISPTSVSGMAVTAHTSGTVANDYAQILAFGIAGATFFYDGILWDGDSSLPDEATYTSSTTPIGQVVTGMGTVNVNTLDLAFMTNFDTTQPFLPAPGGAAAYPDALGPYANTNSPSDSIGVLFKFSGSPLTADLMSSSVATKNWVTIGDAIPVGPPQPPTGVWGSHEGVDIWSAAGFVPAFGTMNPTEHADTTGGAPNIPPFTGVGWLGWVPAFATLGSTDSPDRAVAEGWVIGVPLTGVMGPTESKDRAALSNRATVTGTMGLTELSDRLASAGFEIPKVFPTPPRKRRVLIVS